MLLVCGDGYGLGHVLTYGWLAKPTILWAFLQRLLMVDPAVYTLRRAALGSVVWLQ